MEVIGWIVAIVMFIIAFAGLVYPIIPSALFIVGGFLLYGLIDTFDGMNWLFWIIQVLFVILLFGADTLVESSRCEKIWWFEGRNVGKYNWTSYRSFRHSGCRYFNWTFSRCSYCRT